MAKSNNKKSIQSYIKKLNEIDINALLASIQNINLDDLKNIDIKQIANKIKKSPITKPTLGIISASLLFTFILLPSIERLIFKFKTARQYQNESNNLELIKTDLNNGMEKIEKVSLKMSEINNSILNRDKLIFITKLINETAIKSNVEISSFFPIDSSKSAKLCKQSNNSKSSNRRTNRRSGNSKNKSNKKDLFQTNLYEINLKSDYINIIEFIKIIQYYDVTIIPLCLEVSVAQNKGNRSRVENSKNNNIDNNPTIITPLSKLGVPLDPSQINRLRLDGTSGQVEARLILKIPSHRK